MVCVAEKRAMLETLDKTLSDAINHAALMEAERDHRIAMIIYFLETARLEISDMLRRDDDRVS